MIGALCVNCIIVSFLAVHTPACCQLRIGIEIVDERIQNIPRIVVNEKFVLLLIMYLLIDLLDIIDIHSFLLLDDKIFQ